MTKFVLKNIDINPNRESDSDWNAPVACDLFIDDYMIEENMNLMHAYALYTGIITLNPFNRKQILIENQFGRSILIKTISKNSRDNPFNFIENDILNILFSGWNLDLPQYARAVSYFTSCDKIIIVADPGFYNADVY